MIAMLIVEPFVYFILFIFQLSKYNNMIVNKTAGQNVEFWHHCVFQTCLVLRQMATLKVDLTIKLVQRLMDGLTQAKRIKWYG